MCVCVCLCNIYIYIYLFIYHIYHACVRMYARMCIRFSDNLLFPSYAYVWLKNMSTKFRTFICYTAIGWHNHKSKDAWEVQEPRQQTLAMVEVGFPQESPWSQLTMFLRFWVWYQCVMGWFKPGQQNSWHGCSPSSPPANICKYGMSIYWSNSFRPILVYCDAPWIYVYAIRFCIYLYLRIFSIFSVDSQ